MNTAPSAKIGGNPVPAVNRLTEGYDTNSFASASYEVEVQRMTHTAKKVWDGAKIAIALGTLVVAIVALAQSCAASKESGQTAKRQNELADEQNKLAEQALVVQQKSFDRQGPNLAINDIQISLGPTPTEDSVVYPAVIPAQEFKPVPIEVWQSHPDRYALFTLANPGDSSVVVKSVGLGVSAGNLSWAPSYYWFCMDKATSEYSSSCPRELPPRTETHYSFALDDSMLAWLDENWVSKGLEICARLEAVNASYCARSTETTLPPGVAQSRMPPPK